MSPILFEELPERLPTGLFVSRLRQVRRQIGNGHGLVASHARSPVCRNSLYTTKIACRGKLPRCPERLDTRCRRLVLSLAAWHGLPTAESTMAGRGSKPDGPLRGNRQYH